LQQGKSAFAENDLWEFSPSNSQWTWVDGSKTDEGGNYGTQGVGSTSNFPGSRWGQISWTDSSGGFWLYGGINSVSGNDHADLWKYAPYQGPGDIAPGASAWWGLRGYNAAAAAANTKAINIRRASDNSTQDIVILANGSLGATTASAFCSSTTCYVDKFYDQTGNGNTISQATTGSQPQLIFNCQATHPCIQAGPSEQSMSFTNTYTIPYTITAVAMRNPNGSVNTADLFANTSSTVPLAFSGTANTVYMNDGNTNVSISATDSAWNAIQAVHNYASSSMNADGASSSGNPGSSNTTGSSVFDNDQHSQIVSFGEIGWWSSALTSVSLQRINSNQRSYWAF
jgi:hypothetical protein